GRRQVLFFGVPAVEVVEVLGCSAHVFRVAHPATDPRSPDGAVPVTSGDVVEPVRAAVRGRRRGRAGSRARRGRGRDRRRGGHGRDRGHRGGVGGLRRRGRRHRGRGGLVVGEVREFAVPLLGVPLRLALVADQGDLGGAL